MTKKIEPQPTNKLLNFADFIGYSDTFIETGTCYGRSVSLAIAAGYRNIRSVEAKEEYYLHCKKLFEGSNNIQLYLGKSIDRLPDMLARVNGPAVFWLDAHVSGEASAGYEDYMAKGEASDYHQHTALKKELKIVLAHNPNHVILIDDQNGYNNDNAVYIQMMTEANPNYKFYWYDEQMGDKFYKDKILAAIPG